MYGTYINDKIREAALGVDWRGHLPMQVTDQYDVLARYAGQMSDRYSYQITELDATYTAIAKALVVALLFKHYLVPAWNEVWAKGPLGAMLAIYTATRDVSRVSRRWQRDLAERIQYLIGIFLRLPFVSSKVTSELADLRRDLSAKVAPKTFPDGINLTTVRSLPEKGRSKAWLEEEWNNLKKLERGDVDSGRVSGTVYHVRRYEYRFVYEADVDDRGDRS